MTAVQTGNFVFVHQTASDSAGTLQANRRKVRQRVRQHIGNQRKTARLQSLDIRQLVVPDVRNLGRASSLAKTQAQSLENAEEDINSPLPLDVVGKQLAPPQRQLKVPPTLVATDYAAARIRYNFDLSWLSAITISHVGSFRISESLAAWIRYRERTFLDLVPAYYSRSQLLQRVVDSILAKAANILRPSQETRKHSLRTYGEALQGVQSALVNSGSASFTEILCAIRMLQIYELLAVTVSENHGKANISVRQVTSKSRNSEDVTDQDDAGEDAEEDWSVTGTHNLGSHAQAMQHLVIIRGPSMFQTEMDKLLICSLIEDLWLQAYLSNTDYFLEREEWQVFLSSISSPKDALQHPISLGLWITLVKLPRLLRQAGDIIGSADHHPKLRQCLQLELCDQKKSLTRWLDHYEKGENHRNFSATFYQELLGFGLGTLAITCRLLLALDPGAANAFDLEAEAQKLSERTFELLIEHIVSPGFFVGVIVWATATEWRDAICNAQAIRKQTGRSELLDREVFAKWNGMLGRKPHSERRGTPWRKEVDETIKRFLTTAKTDVASGQSSYTGIVWYI